MTTASYIVSTFRFIAEVLILIILIAYGLRFDFSLNILLGMLLPILLSIIWAIVISPQAKNKLSSLLNCLKKFAIYTATSLVNKQFIHTLLPVLYANYTNMIRIYSKMIDKTFESNAYI